MTTFIRYLSAALAATTVLGCAPPPSKSEFNNNIAKTVMDLASVGVQYRKALSPHTLSELKLDKTNLDNLKAAYNKMQDILRKAKKTYDDKDCPLPSDAEQAAKLKDAFVVYLNEEEKIIDLAGEIIKIVEDASLKDDQKIEKIQKILEQARQQEKTAFDELDKVHRSFCEAYNFKPVASLDQK